MQATFCTDATGFNTSSDTGTRRNVPLSPNLALISASEVASLLSKPHPKWERAGLQMAM